MVRDQKPCLSGRQAVTGNQNKNLAEFLRKKLPRNIFNIIRKIGNLTVEKGFAAYIVGGFVRDILLGVKNLDLDFVIEGDALAFVKQLKDRFDLDVVTHQRFGTAIVTLPRSLYLRRDTTKQKGWDLAGAFKIDIASARREHYAYAAALPKVYLSSIREDLFRRDFTINALAIKINRDDFGQLLDLFDGKRDLLERKIRVLHDRSFIDDPTRILRGIRFEQRYNFTIERHTARLMKEALRSGMLQRLSKFRVGDEIILVLKEETPLKSLVRISKLCGLSFIHPLIKLDKTTARQFKSAKRAISLFRKMHYRETLDNWLVYFMILTGKLSPGELKRLCQDFSFTKKDTHKIEFFKKNAAFSLKVIDRKDPLLPHQIHQILHPFSYEQILVLLCLAKSKRVKKRIRLFLHKLSRIKIKLMGKDLKKLRLKPGPKYKDILRKVLDAKIDGKLKSKAAELNYARSLLRV